MFVILRSVREAETGRALGSHSWPVSCIPPCLRVSVVGVKNKRRSPTGGELRCNRSIRRLEWKMLLSGLSRSDLKQRSRRVGRQFAYAIEHIASRGGSGGNRFQRHGRGEMR